MVVSEVVVVTDQQHFHLQLFFQDGAHEAVGVHLCQFVGEGDECHFVYFGLFQEGCLFFCQREQLGMEIALEHLHRMVGKGDHRRIESSLTCMVHYLPNHELMALMDSIEGAYRCHAG